ncbi:MAG: radical SAM protein [Candidatus Coatesbacteria bacterium]|nr:radical SAM protein [Candidatus Coatesbacteria bacterium]
MIWKFYEDKPCRMEDELSIDEIERVFSSMGGIVFFNISGGEPFMRDDFPDIVALALRHLSPKIIHIPTNGLMPDRIFRQVKAMLEHIESTSPGVKLSVKPSLDGLGEQQDEIRGVPGCFDKVVKTIKTLLPLSERHQNFLLEVGTVISRLNWGDIDRIAEYVHSLGIESYRNELAEVRAEFANEATGVTPSPEEYGEAIARFRAKTIESLEGKSRYTRMLESLRLVYYGLALKVLREQRQVIPCFAGISNAHIDPYGNIWPCCTLANDAPLGSLRDVDYNFMALWHSEQAAKVRSSIRRGECYCPLANQAYSNILLSPLWLLRTLWTFTRFAAFR